MSLSKINQNNRAQLLSKDRFRVVLDHVARRSRDLFDSRQDIRIYSLEDVIVASLSEEDCCRLADLPVGSAAGCRSLCPAGTKPKRLIAAKAGRVIGAAARGATPASYECAMASASNATAAAFAGSVRSKIGSGSSYFFDGAGYAFYPLQNSTPLINQQ